MIAVVIIAALAFWSGLAAGAGIVYTAHRRWADEHHYRRVRLEATRVRDLYRTSDHYLRTAKRAVDALRALRGIHHEVIGDLLDTVADKQAVIDQLTRPRHRRRSAMPNYGPPR